MIGGVSEEIGHTTRSFFEVMKESPLALGLIISNFILLGYLFYSGSTYSAARKETTDLIVQWQREADKLMASCVSSEIMKMVLDALERDRELYRKMLPQNPLPPVPQGDPSRPSHTLFQLPP
jgi:hypothetical protein